MSKVNPLRVFVHADVLYRAATPSHSATASVAVLYLARSTVLEMVTSRYTLDEALRNVGLRSPIPAAALMTLVDGSVELVASPSPAYVARFPGQADVKDLPNLAAAVFSQCQILLTFNTRDYFPPPGLIRILPPGDLILRVRESVARLAV